MEQEIGNAAGVVWQYLDQHGETTLSKLKRETKLLEPTLLMALGWLARERKLSFVRDKKSIRVSLNRT